jgi:protein-S-isoprenylcysteine O-methyltransferase Ste14
LLSAVLILLAVFLYSLFHSFLASLWAKARARRWLGPAVDRFYRLFFNGIGVVTLLPVLALVPLLPDRLIYTVPFPWWLLFLGVQGLAVVGLLVGLMQTGIGSFLGLSQLMGEKQEVSLQLVMGGLYRWVRHPLYTAGLVLIWFTPFMTQNLLALYAGFTLYLVVGASFEERKLLREFGETYIEYRKRTPMLIPGWRRRMRGLNLR